MKAKDKFGNEIYSDSYDEICQYGARLKGLGYEEARDKPNLFYFQKTGGVAFFMDMRGTRQVKIWENTKTLFYWNIELSMPTWAERRMLSRERERLLEHEVPLRLSFYTGFDEGSISDPFADFAPDGYCYHCGTDMKEGNKFCSEHCERAMKPNSFCETCNDRLEQSGRIRHHVSYFPEETVTVCRSCHNKIHMNEDFHPEITPQQEEVDRFYEQ
jgi:hypothetical protein